MDSARQSRRDEYSAMTRRALLEGAARKFAELGFPATSLDELAAEARVTKGAIYHHFGTKQALFESVAHRAAEEACAAILAAAAAEAPDTWRGVVAAIDCFLERCLDPIYRRLWFQEGPAVLGFEQWWAQGEQHEIGLVRGMLACLQADGMVEFEDLDTLTQLLFGSMCAAALALARAPDPRMEMLRVRKATLRLITGLRPSGGGPPEGIPPSTAAS